MECACLHAVVGVRRNPLSPRKAATGDGFHNNSATRYDAAAAELAWQRMIARFGKCLA
jgi:dienelactone hydrolase